MKKDLENKVEELEDEVDELNIKMDTLQQVIGQMNEHKYMYCCTVYSVQQYSVQCTAVQCTVYSVQQYSVQ